MFILHQLEKKIERLSILLATTVRCSIKFWCPVRFIWYHECLCHWFYSFIWCCSDEYIL